MAADPDLIALFVRGWAMTRGVAPPIPMLGGHYLEVAQPDQNARYVFPALDAAVLSKLARSIREPCVFLKVCEAPETIRPLLPPDWIVREPPSWMMTAPLRDRPADLPANCGLTLATDGAIMQARIEIDGMPVARGRIALLGEAALFDQISTDEPHRRRGLGRALMQGLTDAALERGASNGLLCATEIGRALYENVGWTVHSPYTSAVIPA